MVQMLSALMVWVSTLATFAAAEDAACGLYLLQVDAQRFASAPTVASGKTRCEPIDIADVVDQLAAINTSLDKVTEVVDYVNATALDMLSTAIATIEAFSDVLPGLQSTLEVIKRVPGSEGYSDKVASLLDTANKTLETFTSKLQAIPGMIDSYAKKVLPPLVAMAQDTIGQFTSAAEQIRSVQEAKAEKLKQAQTFIEVRSEEIAERVDNEVEKLSDVAAEKNRDEETESVLQEHENRVQKARRFRKNGKRSRGAKGAKRRRARKWRRAEAISLLQARAIQSNHAGSTSFQRAVAAKGQSACGKAAASIKKANSTVGKFGSKLSDLNETANNFFDTVLDVVESGLQVVNSTLSAAMQAAEDVPAKFLDPLASKLSDLLEMGDDVSDSVQDAKADVEAKSADTTEPLDALCPLPTQLQDAADEACSVPEM